MIRTIRALSLTRVIGLAGLAAPLVGCAAPGDASGSPADMPIETRPFGTTKDGVETTLYTLRSPYGLTARVTDFGATLVEMHTPDFGGALRNVVLGFPGVAGYESDANQYFGCTTGRVCNRIALGRFTLDGEEFELATNNAPNHLHGGDRGFGQVVWDAEPLEGASIRFTRTSPDGEEGYPGELVVSVTYTLTDESELIVEYEATTDARTPVSLTNHAYWNLSGAGIGTIMDHVLRIDADGYTPCDETLIPTGEIAPVEGTALDFREPTRIGDRIEEVTATAALGYDHNYVLIGLPGKMKSAARLHDPRSGRTLSISTTEPGIQFYSGNFLKGDAGLGGTYEHRGALCLETQHFPDSVNQPSFPSTILEPGETYRSTTVHTFTVKRRSRR